MFSITLISSFVSILMVLMSVAFISLLERKILGSIQIRSGPNKVGMEGIMQPFSDALKLYSKEDSKPSKSNMLIFYISPMMGLTFSLMCWVVMPYFKTLFTLDLGLMMYISILGLGVYTLLMAGWSSNSAYAMLGAMRCIAQTISYEVTLIFTIMSLFIINGSLNFYDFSENQKFIWYIFLMPLFTMWVIIMLAELNRTPFDFGEGESELVSGFNVEYSGVSFAFIFMSEYAMIVLAGLMTSIMFLGSDMFSILLYMKSSMVSFTIIWVRATLPRYRYDKLMYLTWKILLPISLYLTMVNVSIMMFL